MLELRRKLFHICSLLLLIIPVLYFPFWLNIFIFSSGILLNLLLVLKNEKIYPLFKLFIDLFEREENLEKPGIQSLYALLGIFISYLLFGKDAVYGIVVLAVGDGFSGLIGHYFGKRRLFYNPKKSLEGSLAFFLSSFIALLFITELEKAFLISLVSAFVESLKLPLDDNLLIPIVASFIGGVL
ncbi:SEC59/DGK1/VTE5 family protein [Aquifex pyrophilus]